MTPPDDGGPAFAALSGQYHHCQEGMSLRDFFAAAALQGWMMNQNALDGVLATAPPGENFAYSVAINAYGMADAMLRAREASDV